MHAFVKATATALLALLASPAVAQDYPGKPITLVAPFAAGSPTDAYTRIVGAKLSERLKQPVIVENRPGANAMLGTEYVARAAPDGYTLLVASSTSHSSNPSLFKMLRYDPVKDFTPIGRTVDISYLLLVHPDLPAKTVKELVAYAKANPDRISYATPNSPSQVVAESMRSAAGIKIVGIPYKASPQAMTDLIAGVVQMYVADVPSALGMVQAGKVRPLAVTTLQRLDKLPDVPPLADEFPGVDIVSWSGLFGPAGMPKPIVDKLFAELQATLADPEVAAKLATSGFNIVPSKSPAEFGQYVEYQVGVWSKLVKQAGIEPQ